MTINIRDYLFPNLQQATAEQLKIIGVSALGDNLIGVAEHHKEDLVKFAKENSFYKQSYADRVILHYLYDAKKDNTPLEEIVETAREIRNTDNYSETYPTTSFY